MNVLNIFRQMYAGMFLKINQKQIMLKRHTVHKNKNKSYPLKLVHMNHDINANHK